MYCDCSRIIYLHTDGSTAAIKMSLRNAYIRKKNKKRAKNNIVVSANFLISLFVLRHRMQKQKKDRRKTRTGHIKNAPETRVRVINFVRVAGKIIKSFRTFWYVVRWQLHFHLNLSFRIFWRRDYQLVNNAQIALARA